MLYSGVFKMPNKIDHRKSKSVNYVNKKATPNDKFLSKDRKEKDNQLKTNQGWHDHKPKIPADARSYWSFKEENHEADGILFKNPKMTVPERLRPEMLKTINEAT